LISIGTLNKLIIASEKFLHIMVSQSTIPINGKLLSEWKNQEIWGWVEENLAIFQNVFLLAFSLEHLTAPLQH